MRFILAGWEEGESPWEGLWGSWSTPGCDRACSGGVRQGHVFGWQYLSFHRLRPSQACSSRFQTDVKHNNILSGVSPVHQFHSNPPVLKAAAHMICPHSPLRVCHPPPAALSVWSSLFCTALRGSVLQRGLISHPSLPHLLCCPWLFLSFLPPPRGCSLSHVAPSSGVFYTIILPREVVPTIKSGREHQRVRSTMLSMSYTAHAYV